MNQARKRVATQSSNGDSRRDPPRSQSEKVDGTVRDAQRPVPGSWEYVRGAQLAPDDDTIENDRFEPL